MGCRARAYAASGDYLAEEPFCVYEPKSPKLRAQVTKGNN
jgi:MoaA/NifB/PqqE/SkfB family radical SAM enzyme